jgi:hypothetical protein
MLDARRIWAVGDEDALFRTADGGLTWRRSHPGIGKSLTAIHFEDSGIGWLGGYGRVARTEDDGDTWTVTLEAEGVESFLGIVSHDGRRVYTATRSYWDGGNYWSEDGGRTWLDVPDPEIDDGVDLEATLRSTPSFGTAPARLIAVFTATWRRHMQGETWRSDIWDMSRRPSGADVVKIEIDADTEPCGGPDVRARTATFAAADEPLGAHPDLCSLAPEAVASIASRFATRGDCCSARGALVVACGARTNVLRLPFPVHRRALRRRAPTVLALYDLLHRLDDLDLGWSANSHSRAAARQREGQELVSRLRAGEYDVGFWYCPDETERGQCDRETLHRVLDGYEGPAVSGAPVGRLVELHGGELLEFHPPSYAIGWAARLSGRVEVSLQVDGETMSVVEASAETLEGPGSEPGRRLLETSAREAARRWRIRPLGGSGTAIRAVVEYRLDDYCPESDDARDGSEETPAATAP